MSGMNPARPSHLGDDIEAAEGVEPGGGAPNGAANLPAPPGGEDSTGWTGHEAGGAASPAGAGAEPGEADLLGAAYSLPWAGPVDPGAGDGYSGQEGRRGPGPPPGGRGRAGIRGRARGGGGGGGGGGGRGRGGGGARRGGRCRGAGRVRGGRVRCR